jgi:hypothetical protein
MEKFFIRTLQLVALATAFICCKDNCQQTVTYRGTESVKITLTELRSSVKTSAARTLESPGKIYLKDNFLFINEIKKGIHIIDNTNPTSPKAVAFIEILGNIDMAVRGNILYVDSYTDFVALDISNPSDVKEVSRVKDVFTNGQVDGIWWSVNPNDQTIYDGKWKMITTTREISCEPQLYYNAIDDIGRGVAFYTAIGSSGISATGTGTGGSSARFTIVNNFLYAVTQDEMKLFSLLNPLKPLQGASVKLGFGIETIFPYKDKLFVGTTIGMQIWDNKIPEKPTFLSRLEHVRACDPVVVENDVAYVTLRSINNFTRCGVAIANQLDVIDVSNPLVPNLLKSYPMDSPYGLGIDKGKLFICEGTNGLKVLNATNSLDIKQLQHFKEMNTFDVIPLNGTLMVIGKDGLYQYDYSDINNLKLLSKIAVKPLM